MWKSFVSKRFFPDLYADSIYDIPYERLKAERIEGLIFDIDNTLVPFDVELPTPEVLGLMARLQGMGFKICLLSNNRESRVAGFNIQLALPSVSRARKPGGSGVLSAMKQLGTTPETTAQIGDQVFTDVWCGRRMSLFTVLVKPVSARDEFTVVLKRGVEKWMIQYYLKHTVPASKRLGNR